MAPIADDKKIKEEANVQVLSDDNNGSEVKETNKDGAEVTGHEGEQLDDDEVQGLQSLGGSPLEYEEGDDDDYSSDEDDDDDDDDDYSSDEDDDDDDEDDEEDDEKEEDLGTENVVNPVSEAGDKDDASNIKPDENGLEEKVDEDSNLTATKSESWSKRKREYKDHNEPEEEDHRPSKK